MEDNDPFASLSPKAHDSNSKQTGERASNSPLLPHPAPSLTTDDIGIVVDRVVNRVVKEAVAPMIDRVRLTLEAKFKQVHSTLEAIEDKQKQLGEELAALKVLFEEENVAGSAGNDEKEGSDLPVEQEDEEIQSEQLVHPESKDAPKSSIAEVESLRAGLQALMRENEARMKLLDARLAHTEIPPPAQPAPPPPRPYIPHPPPPPLSSAMHVPPPPTHGLPPPPPPPTHGLPPPQHRVRPEPTQQPPSVPVERVIDEIAVMGFSRDEVRNVLRELAAQGKPVDMNVVLDRLAS